MKNFIKPISIILSLIFILSIAIFGLGDALAPLLFSFVLAYLVFPLINKLEKKGIQRNFSVTAIFISFFLLLTLTIALILPGLINDSKEFIGELPTSSERAITKIEEIGKNLGYQIDLSTESIKEYVKNHISEISTNFIKSLSLGIKNSVNGALQWLLAVLNLFLIPLFFFYVVNDYENINKEIRSFIPKNIRPKLGRYLSLSNTVLSGYIRGQLLVALALSILYAAGLSIVGLKFGFLIGLFSGLISIIPYAGFTIGFATAMIIAFANYVGIGQIAGVVSVFIIVQSLEGMIITPKLVGDKVGLSALATMLALIIGGNIFGLMGMLIAIPIAAIAKTILAELKNEYQKLELFQD